MSKTKVFPKVKMGYAILIAILLSVFSISCAIAAEAPIRLKFSAYYTAGTPSGGMTKEFCQRLETASEGKVKIDIYWAGALGAAQEQLDLIRGGLADLALIFPVYTPERFPLTLFMELPFFASSGVFATAVSDELVRKNLITGEFKEANVHLLSLIAYPPSHLFSNKKIEKVGDFKGTRVWSGGPVMARTLSLVGASGISLGWQDIYMGLERGTMDAFPTTWGSSIALRLYQVIKYPTIMGFMGGYAGGLIMNNGSWGKLPPDVQGQWVRVCKEFSKDYARIYEEDEVKQKLTWNNYGIKVLEFPVAEKKELAQKLVTVWQEWVEKNEAKGKPAKEIYKSYVKVLENQGEPILIKLPGM